jgi:DNA-binding protein H-NS
MRKAQMASRTINVDKMSIEDIDQLVNELYEAKRAKRVAAMEKLRAKAQEMAKSAGFTLDEIVSGGKGYKATMGKRSGNAKYRNPANPNQTWAGFGARPIWMREAIAKGVSIEKMRVSG